MARNSGTRIFIAELPLVDQIQLYLNKTLPLGNIQRAKTWQVLETCPVFAIYSRIRDLVVDGPAASRQ